MNKFLPLLLTTTLACCFTSPSMAQEAANTIEEVDAEQTAPVQATEKQLQGFVIRHQINKSQISEATEIKADPLVLLHTLKADVINYLEKTKPLNLKTTVTPVFAARLDKELKNVPSLILDTMVNNKGEGTTMFNVPTYKHIVPEDENGGEVLINWKGLDGRFTYPETFEQVQADLTLQGLKISESDVFSMELGRLIFVADLDKDLLPTKMNTTLPTLIFKDDVSELAFTDLTLKTETKKTTSQVEVTDGKLNVGQVNFTVADKKNGSKLESFEFTFGGEEKDKIVKFISTLSIENLTLGEIVGETLTLNHKMDVVLNNLDAPATAQLQQTIRELQNQLRSGKISEDILNFAIFGQLMQLAPAFLIKSPGLALSNIHLDTNKGDLNGALELGINGQKAKSLTSMMELLIAMTMQADFKVDKPLLNLLLTAILGNKEQADTRIKALLKDKTLVETENNYILSATIVDNKLTLNDRDIGAPMDLFMLLMPIAIQ